MQEEELAVGVMGVEEVGVVEEDEKEEVVVVEEEKGTDRVSSSAVLRRLTRERMPCFRLAISALFSSPHARFASASAAYRRVSTSGSSSSCISPSNPGGCPESLEGRFVFCNPHLFITNPRAPFSPALAIFKACPVPANLARGLVPCPFPKCDLRSCSTFVIAECSSSLVTLPADTPPAEFRFWSAASNLNEPEAPPSARTLRDDGLGLLVEVRCAGLSVLLLS